jgi:hypothetical protein
MVIEYLSQQSARWSMPYEHKVTRGEEFLFVHWFSTTQKGTEM